MVLKNITPVFDENLLQADWPTRPVLRLEVCRSWALASAAVCQPFPSAQKKKKRSVIEGKKERSGLSLDMHSVALEYKALLNEWPFQGVGSDCANVRTYSIGGTGRKKKNPQETNLNEIQNIRHPST